jgi:DDE superfamily endonuclease
MSPQSNGDRRAISASTFCQLRWQTARRHGTLSLHAAFNTKTGEVLGSTAARHTSAEFVAFLADIVSTSRTARRSTRLPINLSAHRTVQVAESLERDPRVHMHCTPTYSSWLNQVEEIEAIT